MQPSPNQEHEKLRQNLQNEIEAFLLQGNDIEQVEAVDVEELREKEDSRTCKAYL